jgi:hypothetical protein
MPQLTLDDNWRNSFMRHLDRASMPQLMLVPTSAQASLCQRACYADAREKTLLTDTNRTGSSA